MPVPIRRTVTAILVVKGPDFVLLCERCLHTWWGPWNTPCPVCACKDNQIIGR